MIETLFDSYIAAQPEREQDGKWHPSAIFACPRKALYELRVTEPSDIRTPSRALSVGTALHTLLQASVTHGEGSPGIRRVYHEVEISMPDHDVAGHADTLLELDDGTYEVVEYKSKKMTGMYAAIKKGTLPEPAHMDQAKCYAYGIKHYPWRRYFEDFEPGVMFFRENEPVGDRMRGVRVVYFSKGDEAIREYPEPLTQEWEDGFVRFMDRLNAYRFEGDPYPRLERGHWLCGYCAYETRCWNEDPEGVEI